MRSTSLLFIWASLFASTPSDAQPAHLDTARVYVGTVELPGNRGTEVERFLASVGLGPGYPYCAAFVSYCLSAVSPGPVFPRTRTARAQSFISRAGMRASHVLRGTKHPKPGDILIWAKGNGPYGHAGFVLSWDGRCGTTVEANTGPGIYGSQRDGDGVYVRSRCIDPGAYFRIVSFTPVRYE